MKKTMVILVGLILFNSGCIESFNEGFFRGYGSPYRRISNDMLYQQRMEDFRHNSRMMQDMNNRFMDSINRQSIIYGY